MNHVAQIWADKLPETILQLKKLAEVPNPVEEYDIHANGLGANFFMGFGLGNIGEEIVDQWYNEIRYNGFRDDDLNRNKYISKMCK